MAYQGNSYEIYTELVDGGLTSTYLHLHAKDAEQSELASSKGWHCTDPALQQSGPGASCMTWACTASGEYAVRVQQNAGSGAFRVGVKDHGPIQTIAQQEGLAPQLADRHLAARLQLRLLARRLVHRRRRRRVSLAPLVAAVAVADCLVPTEAVLRAHLRRHPSSFCLATTQHRAQPPQRRLRQHQRPRHRLQRQQRQQRQRQQPRNCKHLLNHVKHSSWHRL